MSWTWCNSGCQQLFGNQNRVLKSLWATKTLMACRENARERSPIHIPDCEVYAIKDEILWRTFPWETSYSHPSLGALTIQADWEGMGGKLLSGMMGAGRITLDPEHWQCEGSYRMTDGQRGKWILSCRDGLLTVDGNFKFLGDDQSRARGTGIDNLGRTVTFSASAFGAVRE